MKRTSAGQPRSPLELFVMAAMADSQHEWSCCRVVMLVARIAIVAAVNSHRACCCSCCWAAVVFAPCLAVETNLPSMPVMQLYATNKHHLNK